MTMTLELRKSYGTQLGHLSYDSRWMVVPNPGVWRLMAGLPYLVCIAGFGLRAPKNPSAAMTWRDASRRSASYS